MTTWHTRGGTTIYNNAQWYCVNGLLQNLINCIHVKTAASKDISMHLTGPYPIEAMGSCELFQDDVRLYPSIK